MKNIFKNTIKSLKVKVALLRKNVREKIDNFFKKAEPLCRSSKAEGFVDSAIAILISVVIGALLLAGLYTLFDKTVLPTLVKRVADMFNYAG